MIGVVIAIGATMFVMGLIMWAKDNSEFPYTFIDAISPRAYVLAGFLIAVNGIFHLLM